MLSAEVHGKSLADDRVMNDLLNMTSQASNVERVLVGGFPTVSITRQGLARLMVQDCLAARLQPDTWMPKLVFSSNGQGIALAGQNESFRQMMAEADIIHADGMSVVYASRMTRAPLAERIATTDFFHDAADAAVTNGLKFFILGAKEEQNKQAVEAINRLYPDIEIVGRHHGYFEPEQDEAVCAAIRASAADVLWVALGKPRQEQWCVRNRENLRGVGWIKTCGGLYAFLTGDAPRAPMWMQKLTLEWLFRIMHDPKRLLWRYLTTNPYSFYRLLRYTERSRGRL
jgi:N-acetylglucosaminyldiphosphoundecaprenol N-acetyl-beta-D-mannosaminyltransferase